MISFEQVSKKYHEKTALVNAHFHLQRGAMAFLTGHSGAGKSTLLKHIIARHYSTRFQHTIKSHYENAL